MRPTVASSDRSRTGALAWGLLVVLLATAVPATGLAQSAGAVAEALFREGREAMERGDHEEACRKFAESQRLEPAVGTLLNLATCEEKLGKVASAWQHFQEAAQSIASGDARKEQVPGRAAALEKRVPRLRLTLGPGAPPETTARVGEIELRAESFGVALPFDPGTLQVVASAPGRADRAYEIVLAEGEQKELAVEPGEAKPVEVATPGPVPPPVAETTEAKPAATAASADDGGSAPVAGYVIGGLGLVGIAVGAVTGVMVLGKKSTYEDHCDADGFCDQTGLDAADSGKTLSTVSTIGWGVGLAGVAVGTVLILIHDPGGGEASASIGATPAGGPALVVDGRF